MAGTIDFYFEFSSPFGYLASEMIEPLAEKHGRAIRWKPFLLGAVFKREGTQSLVSYPMKGPYSRRDIERSAAYYGFPYKWPPQFPVFTVTAARATLWAQEKAPDKAVPLIHAIYRSAFAEGADIGKPETILAAAKAAGLDPDEVAEGMKSEPIKARLKDENEAAMDRGVFGSPFFIVDDEPFWGVDRLSMMESWIARGCW